MENIQPKSIQPNYTNGNIAHKSISSVPNLKFYGGKILKNPKFVGVYLGKYWNSKSGIKEKQYLDKFQTQLPVSKYTNIWKEYGVNAGKYLGSEVIVPKSLPREISERSLEQAVKVLVKNSKKDTLFAKGDSETVYTFFLPPNVTLSTNDGTTSRDKMGGFHGRATVEPGKYAYYSAIVYSNKTNGLNFTNKPLDNITIATSHEWTETATDPDVGHGKLGWYDKIYGEVADIPINIGLPLKDTFGRIDEFAVQKEWSNRRKGFVIE